MKKTAFYLLNILAFVLILGANSPKVHAQACTVGGNVQNPVEQSSCNQSQCTFIATYYSCNPSRYNVRCEPRACPNGTIEGVGTAQTCPAGAQPGCQVQVSYNCDLLGCGNHRVCFTRTPPPTATNTPTPIIPTATPTGTPPPSNTPTQTPTPTPTTAPGRCTPGDCQICPAGMSTCTEGQGCKYYTGDQSVCSAPPYSVLIEKCYPMSSCASATPTPTQGVPTGTPPPTEVPTAVPTEDTICRPGVTSCNCSGANAHNCARCGGGWCNAGTCEMCQPDDSGPAYCTPEEPGRKTCDCKDGGESCNSGACVTEGGSGQGVCGKSDDCSIVNGKEVCVYRCTSCSPAGSPPPSPTPTYIAVENFTTPTPKPKTPGQPAQSWKCLKAEPYSGDVLPDGANSDHRLKLTDGNFPNRTAIYIVGCALLNNNFYCTTGDSALDSRLQIRKSPEHVFAVSGNPEKRTTDNKLPEIIVRSKTETSAIHSFYAVYMTNPSGDPNNQAGSTLQFSTPENTSTSSSVKCLAVRWDPFGRVFDNESLEPIPGVKIQLQDEKKEQVKLPGLINPDTTDRGGTFTFLVEPGTYFLNLINSPYKMIAKKDIHPDATKAYFDIYSPGEAIVEKAGKPEHRDVAVDTGIRGPIYNSPSSLDFTAIPVPGTLQTKLLGQVSHPLTLVYFKQNNKEIASTVADKYGFYEVQVENKRITPGEKIVPYFKKVNLVSKASTKKNENILEKVLGYVKAAFNKSTSAAPEPAIGASVDVILPYINGIMYDQNTPLRNAKVEVKMSMSDQTSFETTTDEKGYMEILPQYLPPFSYYLLVNGTVKITPAEFMNSNTVYLQQNDINLMTATMKGKLVE